MNLFQLRKQIESKTGEKLPASDVAKAIGISKQLYSAYERGIVTPSIEAARKMMLFFRQWLPDLDLDQMVVILDETKAAAEAKKKKGVEDKEGKRPAA